VAGFTKLINAYLKHEALHVGGPTLAASLLRGATSAFAKPPCPVGRLAWASTHLLMTRKLYSQGCRFVKIYELPFVVLVDNQSRPCRDGKKILACVSKKLTSDNTDREVFS
jgi:hypothetical protein